MKRKKLILHGCALILALIGAVTFTMGAFRWEQIPESGEEGRETYCTIYTDNLNQVMEFAQAQITYQTDYWNFERVVLQNREFGDVKVRDLFDWRNEAVEYNYGDDASFGLYENTLSGKIEEIEDELLNTQNTSEKNVNRETLRRKLEYYKQISKQMEDFSECIDTLVGYDEKAKPENISKKAEDYQQRLVFEGFCYEVCCNIKNQEYVVSNVGRETDFNSDNFESVASFDNGDLAFNADKNVFSIDEKEVDLDLFDSVTSAWFAVDISPEKLEKFEKELKNAVPYKEGIDVIGTKYIYYYSRNQYFNAPSIEKIQQEEKKIGLLFAVAAASAIAVIVLAIPLLCITGKNQKGGQVQTCAIDRLWIDVSTAILTGMVFFGVFLTGELYWEENLRTLCFVLCAAGITGSVELALLTVESLVRRIQTKTLVETTLIGKLLKFFKKIFKPVVGMLINLFRQRLIRIKMLIFLAAALIWSFIAYALIENFEASSLTAASVLTIWFPFLVLCIIFCIYLYEKQKLVKGIEKIAGGEIHHKIDEQMYFFSNRQLAGKINEIGTGLNQAVEESMKNERMKTELITNVSHDLKTPLTSIINYVDLLKTEGLDSEKATEYLEILSQKSQRLKTLTEDLVEASKLNSGVAEMEMERIDLTQLVNQSLAEYEDRFAKRNLQVVKNIPNEPIYVLADGRKTWRLFDNLYNNAAKYAMLNTRIYVDICVEQHRVSVSIKNISESPLNYSGDELMERFVRGDVSRNTEGSGLGLSIAQSIAKRQNGDLEILSDGDLFKATLTLDLFQQEQK